MDKFILGVIIVVFCSFCGFLLAKKYKKRKLFFTQLYEFNERFLNEVTYYRRPIEEFSSKYIYKEEFSNALELFLQNVKNGVLPPLSLDSIDFSFLSTEEKQSIEDYFNMLGKGDSSSQKAYFSSKSEALKKWQTDAQTTAKKYLDLYIKLGFLFGLFLLILLI